MDPKDKEIIQLKKLVLNLKKENDYLKSHLYKYELISQIQGEYSILLNPPLKEFKTTKNQKAAFFKIDINDIVCVISDIKSKWIFFKIPQTSFDGIRIVSQKLSFTGSLQAFCNKFDKVKIHLCIVSKSVAVNPMYYYLDQKLLKLAEKQNLPSECDNIAISPKLTNDFIEQKANVEKIISFQKIQFHSK